jgi:hypothetical protein
MILNILLIIALVCIYPVMAAIYLFGGAVYGPYVFLYWAVPLLLVSTLFLRFFSKKNFQFIPLITFILIMVSVFLYMQYMQHKTMNRTTKQDIEYKTYAFDEGSSITLPISFQEDTNVQDDYRVVLGYTESDPVQYNFNRGGYITMGGAQKPMTLAIRFYPVKPIDSINDISYKDTYAYYEVGKIEKIGSGIIRGVVEHGSYPIGSESVKLLTYEPESKAYRIYMQYLKTDLFDDAALDIFKEIVKSVINTK